ncbi:MAG: hypothetical protein QG623_95 [Patescibacteria group bacterium]|nr:hypothetical protein [Patescibacteria group bacterium]
MSKTKLKKIVNQLTSISAIYVALFAVVASYAVGRDFLVSPFVGLGAYYSWRIFVGDIKFRKISNFDIAGLLVSGIAIYLLIAPFEISIVRAVIVFLIGWGMFQLFEGDIGGGDVRLLTVAAVFLNVVQLLAAVSLASAIGMALGYKLKIKRIPFGSLLIVSFWLSFWIVRF